MEFEKWRAIRASVGGMCGVLVCVAYLCGERACVGGVLVWWRRWCACVVAVLV